MEEEKIISGYCRMLDQSRMITVVYEDSQITEVDCCYGTCQHQSSCQVAAQIEELLKQ